MSRICLPRVFRSAELTIAAVSAAGGSEAWDAVARVPQLDIADVHVWRVITSAWRPRVAALRDRLSMDEKARADRFHFAKDRDQYVVAHGALRTLLAHYTGLHPASLRFQLGPSGKPSLVIASAEQPPLFNLAHSADVTLIAVTRSAEVGIDVEAWTDDLDPLDLAAHFFSPGECSELESLAAVDRRRGFFACWARKEAYIKATGVGVSRGLDYFDVTVAPDSAGRIRADRSVTSPARHWSMLDLDVAARYSATVVVEGPHQIRRFHFDPAIFVT